MTLNVDVSVLLHGYGSLSWNILLDVGSMHAASGLNNSPVICDIQLYSIENTRVPGLTRFESR